LNWQRLFTPYQQRIYSLIIVKYSFINKDTIWTVGSDAYFGGSYLTSLVLLTTNGGQTWGYQIPDTANSLNFYRSSFLNKNYGWVYNQLGKGANTIIVDLRSNSEIIANDFTLFQNYPNPFNPSTIINYQLTINSFVTLKIFDINGKEVSTLIKQKQNSGKYEYTFNGNNLPSGIYFYTLTAGVFSDTKKMMLVK